MTKLLFVVLTVGLLTSQGIAGQVPKREREGEASRFKASGRPWK